MSKSLCFYRKSVMSHFHATQMSDWAWELYPFMLYLGKDSYLEPWLPNVPVYLWTTGAQLSLIKPAISSVQQLSTAQTASRNKPVVCWGCTTFPMNWKAYFWVLWLTRWTLLILERCSSQTRPFVTFSAMFSIRYFALCFFSPCSWYEFASIHSGFSSMSCTVKRRNSCIYLPNDVTNTMQSCAGIAKLPYWFAWTVNGDEDRVLRVYLCETSEMLGWTHDQQSAKYFGKSIIVIMV